MTTSEQSLHNNKTDPKSYDKGSVFIYLNLI